MVISGFASEQPIQEWVIEEIESTSVGADMKLIHLPDNSPVLVYWNTTDQTLVSRFLENGFWKTSIIDQGRSFLPGSLVIGANGHPAVAYLARDTSDRSLDQIKVAEFDGRFWQLQVVAQGSETPYSTPVMAADAAGVLSLCYRTSPNGGFSPTRLRHAKQTNTAWSYSVVQDTTYSYPQIYISGHIDIAIAPNGHPAIAFLNQYGLNQRYYAEFDGVSWQVEPIEDDTGEQFGAHGIEASLIFLPNGNPAVALESPTTGQLMFVEKAGGNWEFTTVAATSRPGQFLSLKLKPDGYPAIFHVRDSTRDVRYSEFDGTNWLECTVDDQGNFFSATALSFDSQGVPSVAYADRDLNNLLFAKLALSPGFLNRTRVFDSREAFLNASGASDLGGIPTLSGVEESFTLGSATFEASAPSSFYMAADLGARIPGQDLALNDVENFSVEFASPLYGFGFDFHEPESDPNVGAGFVESTFEVVLFQGRVEIERVQFERENDALAFFGVSTTESFDRLEITEVVGAGENEFFGRFLISSQPADCSVTPLYDGALDAKGTYLQLASDPLAASPLVINLVGLGVSGGDLLYLEGFGDLSLDGASAEQLATIGAVFSVGSALDPLEVLTGGVGELITPDANPPTGSGVVTDILEDFSVDAVLLEVPSGASHLFVGISDSHFSDNVDFDGDLRLKVLHLPCPENDGDGDGLTDQEEMIWGTDPRVRNLVPSLGLSGSASGLNLEWLAKRYRNYVIDSKLRLDEEDWIEVINLNMQGSDQSISLPNPLGSETKAFFQLRVELRN